MNWSKKILLSLLAFASFAFAGHSYAGKPMSDSAAKERTVVQFYSKVWVQRKDVAKMAMRYLTEDYIQHNPYVPTGRQGFIDALGSWLPSIPDTRFEIKRVMTSGDIVILHIHQYDVNSDSPGSAGIDMFRVNSDGKISEHWDVWQGIPEWMPHDNGMF